MRNAFVSLLAFVAAGGLFALLFRPEPVQPRLRPAVERQAMPDLHMPALDGQPWRLADHRGRVVLLNFWASWCPPCREETPGLIRLFKSQQGNGLEVAGVSLDENVDAVRQFSRQFGVTYPLLLPQGQGIASQIESLPTTFLIDRQGRVADVFVGAVSESALRKAVGELLAERL